MPVKDVFEVLGVRLKSSLIVHCYVLSEILLCLCSLQRHFSVFAVNFPSHEAQMSIFSQILCGHLKQQLFSPLVQRSAAAVVQAAITLHHRMVHSFLPTAIKFHYTFNLRDLSNVFQVVLIASNLCNWTFEWKVKYSYDFLCCSGHPFRWAWQYEREHWPGTVVAAWVLQSVLRQTGRCHGSAALPEAPDGDCAWMLWGAIQILINSINRRNCLYCYTLYSHSPSTR